MRKNSLKVIDELVMRYPQTVSSREDIERAVNIMANSFVHGGKLIVCGNGGSAADSQHIVGELMKSFKKPRPVNPSFQRKACETIGRERAASLCANLEGALPTMSLVSENALTTAFGNDRCSSYAFAQQIYGYGRNEDVLWAISTSGNSANVIAAAETAKTLGMSIVSLTGKAESNLSRLSDVCIRVPEDETHKVQELHLPVYHAICAALEEEFFG